MKYLLKFTLIACVLLGSLPSVAQDNPFKKNADDEIDLDGVDSKKYSYGATSFGVFLPLEEADTLAGGLGFTFEISSLVKLKLFSWNSLILEYGYRYENVRMDNDSISNPFYVKNEDRGFENQSFKTHRLQLGLAHRVNFTKPITDLGTYLDLGAWGGYNIGQRLRTDLEIESELNGGFEEQRSILRRPQFTERLAYGLRARIGVKKFALQADYRMNDFFKAADGRFETNGEADENIPDMPRLSVALSFNLGS